MGVASFGTLFSNGGGVCKCNIDDDDDDMFTVMYFSRPVTLGLEAP